jgi:exodeoxyribonuclease VII small subunit
MSDEESFETTLHTLEQAVDRLESGELPLEESLQCFETGMKSAARCQKLLHEVELRVETLLKDEEGNLASEPIPED